MQNKTNTYKPQNGMKDKGKGNTINYYVHKHLLSGLRWLFLNNFPDFFQSYTFCCKMFNFQWFLEFYSCSKDF